MCDSDCDGIAELTIVRSGRSRAPPLNAMSADRPFRLPGACVCVGLR